MRVTSKGQVTIPRRVREILGIVPGTEIDFVEDHGRFFIVRSNQPKSIGRFAKFRGIATANMSTEQILGLTR